MRDAPPSRTSSGQTALIQPQQPQAPFRGALPPVHRTATVLLDDVAALRRAHWSDAPPPYGREGTPTTQELEARLAGIEGACGALLVPSGLAAIYLACVTVLSAGEAVAMPDGFYGSAVHMADALLRRLGIELRRYDAGDPESLARALSPRTRLVWLESAASVTLEVIDIAALAAQAHRAGATVVVDNTYAAGLHLQPFALGVDVSVQALTKLQSGGADVVLGSVACADPQLLQQLKATRHLLGMSVSSDDAYLVLRGLPTLRMRYAYGGDAAARLARWFVPKKAADSVYFPPLESSPGHAHWKRYFTAAPGLFSVALAAPGAAAFVDALRLFHIGYSWGGSLSLVMLYEADHPVVEQLRSRKPQIQAVVRFWVGLEDPEDLLADIAAAWAEAGL